jgi:hypothetical protein
MREVIYRTKGEREEAIGVAEGQGEVLNHDDFSVGPAGENRLTFIVPDPDILDVRDSRLDTLRQKLKSDSITFEEVKELLRLERRL